MASSTGSSGDGGGRPLQIYRMSGETRELDIRTLGKVLGPVKHMPVAFVSVNGVTRSGKSFLLNFFLRYLRGNVRSSDWLQRLNSEIFPDVEPEGDDDDDSDSGDEGGGGTPRTRSVQQPQQQDEFIGFDWRGGSVRHTVGIWIWSQPFLVDYTDPNTGVTDQIAVILMDTQGSFDGATSFRDNAIIFAISVWLSSVFIYNVQDSLSEDKLQFLEYFSDFSNSLKQQAFGKEEPADADDEMEAIPDGTDSAALFQHLMLLVRDWRWPDDYKYGWHSTTEERAKNHVVDFIRGTEGSAAEVIATRRDIVSKFTDTSSFLLPHPGSVIHRRVKSSLPPAAKFEKPFLKYLEGLVSTVFQKVIQPKKMFGDVKTGEDILKLMQSWADILRLDKIPKVRDLNQATADAHLEMALNRAVKHCQGALYKLALEGKEDAEFKAASDAIGAETVEKFRQACEKPNLARYANSYLTSLLDLVEDAKTMYVQLNVSKRTEREQSALIGQIEARTKQLDTQIAQQRTQMTKYQQDIENHKYQTEAEKRANELIVQELKGSIDRMMEQQAAERQAADQRINQLIELANRPPPPPPRRRKRRRFLGIF